MLMYFKYSFEVPCLVFISAFPTNHELLNVSLLVFYT